MDRLTVNNDSKYVGCNIDDECAGMCGSCKRNSQIRRKLRDYENLEERLEKIFNGELPLKTYVDVLERHITDGNKPDPLIARILTYEDAEEWDEYKRLRDSGLFLKLPTRKAFESSGDTVYYIFDYEIVECINCGLSVDYEGVIWIALACDEDIFPYREPIAEFDMDPTDWCINSTTVNIDEWGKSVFLTREEAEQVLSKMEEGAKDE